MPAGIFARITAKAWVKSWVWFFAHLRKWDRFWPSRIPSKWVSNLLKSKFCKWLVRLFYKKTEIFAKQTDRVRNYFPIWIYLKWAEWLKQCRRCCEQWFWQQKWNLNCRWNWRRWNQLQTPFKKAQTLAN